MQPDCKIRTLFTIGNEIHIWCDQNGITIQELADALQISRESVKRIYNGTKAYLTSREIRILSHIMGKPVDFFIPNDDGLEDDAFLANLGQKSSQYDAVSVIKKKSAANIEIDRRLAASVETINNVDDLRKKEHMVRQIELIAETAKWI